MKKHAWIYLMFSTLLLTISDNTQAKEGEFYVKPTYGFSTMSDKTAKYNESTQTLDTSIELDSGFSAGIGFGYYINERFTLELGWEYRSNDSKTAIVTDTHNSGNYASSLISGSVYYSLMRDCSPLCPFAGAGIVYSQEIDIDLERDDFEGNSTERSFSGNGDIGFQLMLGANYQINNSWALLAEVRYISLSNITLSGESSSEAGSFEGLSYQPLDFQLGLRFEF